jgi:hypothetical protein
MRKPLKKGVAPKLLVTDKLRSYGSVFRQSKLVCPHEQGLWKNNRGEFASACAAAGAQDAAVQIGSICTALPQHACRGPQHFQPSTPSGLAINAADLPSQGGERMAECSRGVIAHPASGFFEPIKFNPRKPLRNIRLAIRSSARWSLLPQSAMRVRTTLRWREMDSNLRYRAQQTPSAISSSSMSVRQCEVAHIPAD